MEELKFLEEQQVAPELIKRVEEFRSRYEVAPETAGRIVKPSIPFYGKDILEMAIAGTAQRGEPVTHRSEGNRKKLSLQRTWHIFSTVPRTMFLFM